MSLFKKKKTGFEIMKEKIENADKALQDAHARLKEVHIILKDFYKSILEVQNVNNQTTEEL